MNITTDMLDNLTADLRQALTEIGQKYDIKFGCIDTKYNDISFEMKITADRTDINAGEYRLNAFAQANGYESLYGKRMMIDGHQIALTDYDHKARKWKIIARDMTAHKDVKLSLAAIEGFKIVGTVRID